MVFSKILRSGKKLQLILLSLVFITYRFITIIKYREDSVELHYYDELKAVPPATIVASIQSKALSNQAIDDEITIDKPCS